MKMFLSLLCIIVVPLCKGFEAKADKHDDYVQYVLRTDLYPKIVDFRADRIHQKFEAMFRSAGYEVFFGLALDSRNVSSFDRDQLVGRFIISQGGSKFGATLFARVDVKVDLTNLDYRKSIPVIPDGIPVRRTKISLSIRTKPQSLTCAYAHKINGPLIQMNSPIFCPSEADQRNFDLTLSATKCERSVVIEETRITKNEVDCNW